MNTRSNDYQDVCKHSELADKVCIRCEKDFNTKQVTHTPGPWRVSARHIGTDKSGIVASVSPVDHRSKIKLLEADANARLIAAAPELLEALKKFGRHSMSCAIEAAGYGRKAVDCSCGIDEIIAKAEGK